MINRFVFIIFILNSICCFAQKVDTLFDTNIHYESKNYGPLAYFYKGDMLHFDYTPTIGEADISLIGQDPVNGHPKSEVLLVKKQKSRWLSQYEVQFDGCYQLKFKPAKEIGYIHANMKLARESSKAALPNSCSVKYGSDTVTVGGERILSQSEIVKLRKSPMTYKVDKEISSAGLEYCLTSINIGKNQNVIINFLTHDDADRMNVSIYRTSGSYQTILLNDFQYSITDFGFKSVIGGEYTVMFWGRNVFKRTNDLVIETGN